MINKNLIEQYEIEKRGHFSILNESDPEKRQIFYQKTYDEIYSFFRNNVRKKKSFGFINNSHKLYKFIMKNKVVVDYGCGYGSFTKETAKLAYKVYGIDASKDIIDINIKNNTKENIQYLCQQSMVLPFESESIDIFYSTGVLEHLHPDDANKHLKEVYRCLRKGGYYILITPNKYFGPSDVSKYFLKRGSVAKGLHLKEYTYNEIYSLLNKIGYSKIKTPLILEYIFVILKIPSLFKYTITPSKYKIRFEKVLSKMPKLLVELLRIRGISLIIRK